MLGLPGFESLMLIMYCNFSNMEFVVTSRPFGMKQQLSCTSAQEQCKFIQLLLEYIVSYVIIKRVAFRAP